MTIGLISDTHGLVADDVIEQLTDCHQIWHAGDIGDSATAEKIVGIGPPVRMVWGNIDAPELRKSYPMDWIETVSGLKVYMTHIGGYPGRYYKRVYSTLLREQPDLYICGHSHILKVIPDKDLGLLHMNPGACGVIGFHKFRTMLKFEIIEGKVANLRAVELGLRGLIK